jgi:hypothetical protein
MFLTCFRLYQLFPRHTLDDGCTFNSLTMQGKINRDILISREIITRSLAYHWLHVSCLLVLILIITLY